MSNKLSEFLIFSLLVGCGSDDSSVDSDAGSSDGGQTQMLCMRPMLWMHQFGTGLTGRQMEHTDARDMNIDEDGNIVVAGSTHGTLPEQMNTGGEDAFVRKYDSVGEELWTRQFGTSSTDIAHAASVDAEGNIIVTGKTSGALPEQVNAGGIDALEDAFVRKYDSAGEELWTRQFGTSSRDIAHAVSVDAEGSVIVAGSTSGAFPDQTNTKRGSDVFVRKYDSAGEELWTRQFGSSDDNDDTVDDSARAVTVDTAGNIIIAGSVDGALPTSDGRDDAFVRKYSSAGEELWTRQFGSSSGDTARALSVDTLDHVIVAGSTGGTLPGQTSDSETNDAFVRKYDSAGEELWTHQFGTVGPGASDHANAVSVDQEDNVIVAGSVSATLPEQMNAGKTDAFVRKYDSAGNELWTCQFGSSSIDSARAVGVNAEGHIIVAGITWGAFPEQTATNKEFDAFVTKMK